VLRHVGSGVALDCAGVLDDEHDWWRGMV
jgi:hypothetical protein